MSQPKVAKEQSVTWREYSGDREEIEHQLDADSLPHQWGEREVIANYIMAQVPSGKDWRGIIRVTGYRTPVNDNGTGTSYVSVHWEPKHIRR